MAVIETVPLTYDDIKADISTKFKTKGYDSDYEGSNASILTDSISYTASMINLNTAFNTSEMLLTTASQEKNVRYLARQLGFEGQNIVSYKYSVKLLCLIDSTLPVTDNTKRLYEVPKYSEFTSGSKKYYSVSEIPPLSLSNNDITTALTPYYIETTVKEGTLYLASNYDAMLHKTVGLDSNNNVINYIDIPLTDVEDDGIDVLLTYITADGLQITNEPWYKAEQFLIDTDTNMSKRFIRIEDIEFNTPRIYFKLASIGNDLRPNTEVYFNVITSSGVSGVATGNLSLPTSLSNLSFVSQSLLVTGQAKEDMESIRVNAPLFHNSANRAVTKYDFISICNRHAVVKYSQVWGGEEEFPKQLGCVYFSFVPQSRYNNRTFTLSNNNSLFSLDYKNTSEDNFVKFSELYTSSTDISGNLINPGVLDVVGDYSMSLDYKYRNPVYIDFDYEMSIVKYNTKLSRQETHQNAFNVISSYFMSALESGESDYFNSNIIKKVDTEITDMSGLNLTVTTTIPLYPSNINVERNNIAEKSITIYLGVPYDTYLTDYGIVSEVLPSIDTQLSIGKLTVDFTNITYNDGVTLASNSEYFYFPVLLDGIVVGRYLVNNYIRKFIRIDLYIKGIVGVTVDPLWVTSTLTEANFDNNIVLNLKYNNNNLKTIKNTFPRLSSVRFV